MSYLVVGEGGDEQKKCRVFEMKVLRFRLTGGGKWLLAPPQNGNFDARRLRDLGVFISEAMMILSHRDLQRSLKHSDNWKITLDTSSASSLPGGNYRFLPKSERMVSRQ